MGNQIINNYNEKRNEFLSKIIGNSNNYLEIRAIQGKNIKTQFFSKNDFSKLNEFIESNSNMNIYFGVAMRKTTKNGQKENCIELNCLYLDIDFGDLAHKKHSLFNNEKEVLKHLNRFNLNPTLIVNSGHGLHLYFFLKETILLSNENHDIIESLTKELGIIFGGDSTHNIDRILRVPYTFNRKDPDNPKMCMIVNESNKLYTLEEIELFLNENESIIHLLEKNKQLRNKVFGIFDSIIDDRSRFDQIIITDLLASNINEKEIKRIFRYFPTTGKYLERFEKDPKGAEQYLEHSINNAKKYLDELNSTNQTRNNYKIKYNYNENVNNVNDSSNNCELNDSAISQYEINKEKYFYDLTPSTFGYYYKKNNEEQQISNFIVKIKKQISSKIDGKDYTYLAGEIYLQNREVINFNNLPIEYLNATTDLLNFISNVAGIEAEVYYPRLINKAVQFLNKNFEKIRAKLLGYNDEFTEFITPEIIITDKEIIYQKNQIIGAESLRNKIPSLKYTALNVDEVKSIIKEKLLYFFDFDISSIALSFSFLPLIYPLLKQHINGKPFLSLIGTTGTGKTTFTRFLQKFYGLIAELFSWTSTTTSLQVAGNVYKDCLFVVDDLKESNFRSDVDKKKYVSLLQNYYDEHSRSRSNVNLEIRDEKPIKGFLLSCGEDYVISEPSALARGINIKVNKNHMTKEDIQELNRLSEFFENFTVLYVQYILKYFKDYDFSDLINKNRNFIINFIENKNLTGDNLPRLINNFSLVMTSWNVFSAFLFNENEIEEFNKKFYEGIILIFENNLELLNEFRPEERFFELLWQEIENGELEIIDLSNPYNNSLSKNCAFIYDSNSKDHKIILRFNNVYKHITNSIKNEEKLAISYKSLKENLIDKDIIQGPKSGRVTIKGKLIRGFYYKGEIPEEFRSKFNFKYSQEEHIDVLTASDEELANIKL